MKWIHWIRTLKKRWEDHLYGILLDIAEEEMKIRRSEFLNQPEGRGRELVNPDEV
jgi:hypothetical protein